MAWHYSTCDEKTHPLKKMAANELGLYDMSGNICIWYAGLLLTDDPIQTRAIRGGR